MRNSKIEQIIRGISDLDIEEKTELVKRLPGALGLSPDDLALLSLAERSSAFWDHEDDSRYDEL